MTCFYGLLRDWLNERSLDPDLWSFADLVFFFESEVFLLRSEVLVLNFKALAPKKVSGLDAPRTEVVQGDHADSFGEFLHEVLEAVAQAK